LTAVENPPGKSNSEASMLLSTSLPSRGNTVLSTVATVNYTAGTDGNKPSPCVEPEDPSQQQKTEAMDDTTRTRIPVRLVNSTQKVINKGRNRSKTPPKTTRSGDGSNANRQRPAATFAMRSRSKSFEEPPPRSSTSKDEGKPGAPCSLSSLLALPRRRSRSGDGSMCSRSVRSSDDALPRPMSRSRQVHPNSDGSHHNPLAALQRSRPRTECANKEGARRQRRLGMEPTFEADGIIMLDDAYAKKMQKQKEKRSKSAPRALRKS